MVEYRRQLDVLAAVRLRQGLALCNSSVVVVTSSHLRQNEYVSNNATIKYKYKYSVFKYGYKYPVYISKYE